MKKRILSILLPLLIVSLIIIGLVRRQETAQPVASGILERDRVELPARSAERITAISIQEGDFVRKGTILIRQDDRRAMASLSGAEADYRNAEANLQKMINGPRPEEIRQVEALLTAAEGVLSERSENLERASNLTDRSYSSQAELDAARASWEQARGTRNELAARLALLNEGTREEDLAMAEAALSAAEARRNRAALDLEELTIRAPADGMVDSLPFVEGATPPAGQTLAVLLTGEVPYARVYIPEEWHGRIRPGDRAPVLMDGRKEPYQGVIRRISPDPVFTPYFALNQSDRGHLSYIAKIDLFQPEAANLTPGTPVRVLLKEVRSE